LTQLSAGEYLDLNEQQNKLCLNKGGLSTPENLNDPKYRTLAAIA
jgi:hypothetical protein